MHLKEQLNEIHLLSQKDPQYSNTTLFSKIKSTTIHKMYNSKIPSFQYLTPKTVTVLSNPDKNLSLPSRVINNLTRPLERSTREEKPAHTHTVITKKRERGAISRDACTVGSGEKSTGGARATNFPTSPESSLDPRAFDSLLHIPTALPRYLSRFLRG